MSAIKKNNMDDVNYDHNTYTKISDLEHCLQVYCEINLLSLVNSDFRPTVIFHNFHYQSKMNAINNNTNTENDSSDFVGYSEMFIQTKLCLLCGLQVHAQTTMTGRGHHF